MEKSAALQILMGRLPPMEKGFEDYLERGTCLKIFQNERLPFDWEDEEDYGVLYIHRGLLKLAVHRPYSGTGLNYCFYGDDTLLERRPAAAPVSGEQMYIEACENTVAYGFTRQVFSSILKGDGALLEQYQRFQDLQRSLLFQRMELTACLDAEERVVGWLIQLCRRSAPDGEGEYVIPCGLTQQEIADYLFIHVTTFNRIFGELKKKGIVEKRRSGFLIHDFGRLLAFREHMSL